MPGLVDTHVHINEPGRTDWEGFETATRAAAAGGVTTLIDMPLNSIPATTTAAALEKKRAAARKKCWVNVGFWGGVVPGNAGELRALRSSRRIRLQVFSRAVGRAGICKRERRRSARGAADARRDGCAAARSLRNFRSPIERASRETRKDPIRKSTRRGCVSRPARRGNQSDRDADSPRARIQARTIHIVHLSSELSVAADSCARRRKASASRRKPARIIYFSRRAPSGDGTDGIQVRPAHSRFAK